MPRRIAQERVPTAFNVGSRDVTWASRPTPLIPFRVFSRVSRAPFLRQSGVMTNSEGQVKYCRCTFFGHATPDRAGARPYRVQCRVARCDMGLPAHTSHPLSRLFACFAGPPFLRQSGVSEAQRTATRAPRSGAAIPSQPGARARGKLK